MPRQFVCGLSDLVLHRERHESLVVFVSSQDPHFPVNSGTDLSDDDGSWKSKTAKLTDEEKLLRDALRPKFGKALSKSAVAQRIAANPKSAALRKTSKNNPINKAKRAAHRKNRNHGGDE